MGKAEAVHIYDGVLVIKMNEILPFTATWMDQELLIVSDMSDKKC